MPFSDRIFTIRKKLKLSQEKFGELADVSQRTVAFWEAGDRMPSHAVLADLADRLGVSVDYLLDRSDNPRPADPLENKKEPTAQGGELLDQIIAQIQVLPDPALARVADFLSGLQAGKDLSASAAAAGADPDPADGSAE